MSDPQSPFALSDALVESLAALRPMQATFWGVSGYDDRWDDLSPEGVARVADALRSWRDRVRALPPQSDRWGKLAVHVMLDAIELDLDGIEHGEHLLDLNSIASSFQAVRMAFDSMDTSGPEGWARVASRLESLPAMLEGYRRTLSEGLSKGMLVSVRQVRAAVEQGRVHQGERSYFRSLPERAASVCDPALRARIESAVPGACEAYGALADWLERAYLPQARPEDGVGRARYLRAMRRFLGSTPDPEETYAWGFREVRRIRDEMLSIAEGIAPGMPLPEVLSLLRTDPSRCAPTRESFLSTMREVQAKALRELEGTHFDVPAPIRHIEVREAPPGGGLGAYYVPPSEDFSRPGTVWYAMHGDGPFALYDEMSTAFHEGFPGHHLQCGIQVSLRENLCRLHRLAYGYAGFAEGWALYAEQLMRELGYYPKPENVLGMLANQMMRACRVAIDIGSHLGLAIPEDSVFHPGERWTYELGVEMMQSLGGMSVEHAESELTRYLGWPGQAISYKVGQRAMLSLREEFLREGHPGGLREFHSRVLACGNVGLDLLREQVLGR
jgi:uncharacterized protein (DUF885 family)